VVAGRGGQVRDVVGDEAPALCVGEGAADDDVGVVDGLGSQWPSAVAGVVEEIAVEAVEHRCSELAETHLTERGNDVVVNELGVAVRGSGGRR
jgi:hypothetical protein